MLSTGTSLSSSNYNAGYDLRNTADLAQAIKRSRMHNNRKDKTDICLEAFIYSLKLKLYGNLKEEEKQKHVDNFDAIELFNVLDHINNELKEARIENYVLTTFLEVNDSRLLVGLDEKRSTQIENEPSHSVSPFSSQSIHTMATTISGRSFQTGLSIRERKTYSYQLNFRSKIDLTEKITAEAEQRICNMELRAKGKIKSYNSRIEEMHLTYDEILKTAIIFKLHFLHNACDLSFLELATDRQIDRKLQKFLNSWNKNAYALMDKINLKISALHQTCHALRNSFASKFDLKGILTKADFEKLKIERSKLQKTLDDKNLCLSGVKSLAGRAAIAMAEENHQFISIEDQSKEIDRKTAEVLNGISKLAKEAKYVENLNARDFQKMENLLNIVSKFEAPSIRQYCYIKEQLLAFEKEEKFLRRKLYIIHMKYINIMKRCNK